MPETDFSVKDAFTLWSSHKWSAVLGIVMFLAGIADVLFTFLNVEKYGIAYEANFIARYMIGNGQPLVSIWVALAVLSGLVICLPLLSYYLVLPSETREGRAATVISAVFAARMTIILYGVVTFWYAGVPEAGGAAIALGILIMFLTRFTIRHGDEISLVAVRSAVQNLCRSLRSAVGGLFSLVTGRSSVDNRLPKRNRQRMQDTESGGSLMPKRSNRRIVLMVASLLAAPVLFLTFLEALKYISGVTSLQPYERTLVMEGGTIQGLLFLLGFILTLVVVGVMIYLILAIFKEFEKGR